MTLPFQQALLGPDYLAETRAWSDACTVKPDSKTLGNVDRLIRALKPAGLPALLDALWLHDVHDEQAGRLNVIAPGSFTLTGMNSPAFTRHRGFASDGSASYLLGAGNSSYPKFQQDACAAGVWMDAGGTGTNAMGTSTATSSNRRTMIDPTASGKVRTQLAAAAPASTAAASPGAGGSKIVVRENDSATVKIYAAEALLDTVTSTSAALNALALSILRNGVSSFASAGANVLSSFIGGALTPAQVAVLHNALLGFHRAQGAWT
jgi:hypothetical protein